MTIPNYGAGDERANTIDVGCVLAGCRTPHMIGICTDSHSLLSPELVARFGIEIVPLTINIGDVEYLDGVDIDIDTYYALVARGNDTSMTQPSSGQFALAYDRLAERGADQIVSIHTSLGVAGTLTSARLATRSASVPVKVLDTNSPSFALSFAVWAAARAAARGAALCDVVAAAERVGTSVGSRFVYEASEGCRVPARVQDTSIALMTLVDDEVRVVEHVPGCSDVAGAMAATVTSIRQQVDVVLAHADPCGATMMDDVQRMIGDSANVGEIMHCRIGPSLAGHMGHCGAGVFFSPTG